MSAAEFRMKEWRGFSAQVLQTEKLKKLKMGLSENRNYDMFEWHMCLLKECVQNTPPTDRLLTESEIKKHLITTHKINLKNIDSDRNINLFEILILSDEKKNVLAGNIDISTLTYLMKKWDGNGLRADTCFVCLISGCNFEKDSIASQNLKENTEEHRYRRHKNHGYKLFIKIFYQKTSIKHLEPESRVRSLPSLMSIPSAEPIQPEISDKKLRRSSPTKQEISGGIQIALAASRTTGKAPSTIVGPVEDEDFKLERSNLRVLAQRISDIIDEKWKKLEKQNLPEKDFNLYWHLCVIDECSFQPLSFGRLLTYNEFYDHVKVHGIEDTVTYVEKLKGFGVAILHSGTGTVKLYPDISPLLRLREKQMENLPEQASLEPGEEFGDFESCLVCLIRGCRFYSYAQPEELIKQLTEHANCHSRRETETLIEHCHIWIMDKKTESAPSIAVSEASSAAVSPAERDIPSEKELEVTSYRHSLGLESSEKQKSEKMEQEYSGKTPSEKQPDPEQGEKASSTAVGPAGRESLPEEALEVALHRHSSGSESSEKQESRKTGQEYSGKTPSEKQPDPGQKEEASMTAVGPAERETFSGETLEVTLHRHSSGSESSEKQESEKPKQEFSGKAPSEEPPDAGEAKKASPTAVAPAERGIPSGEALEVTLYEHSSGPEPSEKQRSAKPKQEFSQKTSSEEQPDAGRTEQASSTALRPAEREILSAEDLQVTSYEQSSGSESSEKQKSEKPKQVFLGKTPSEEQPDPKQKEKALSTAVGPAERKIFSGEVLQSISYGHSSGSESSEKHKSEKQKQEFSGETPSEEQPDAGQKKKASSIEVGPAGREIPSGEALEVTLYRHSSGSESSKKQKSEKPKQEFSGKTLSEEQIDVGQTEKASPTAVGPSEKEIVSGEVLQSVSYRHFSASESSEKQKSEKRKQEFSRETPSAKQPDARQRGKASSTAVGPAARQLLSGEDLQVTSYRHSSGSEPSEKQKSKKRKQEFLGKTASEEQPDPKKKKKTSSTVVGPAERDIRSGEALQVTSYGHSSGSESSKKQKDQKQELSGKTLSAIQPDAEERKKASSSVIERAERDIFSREALQVTSYGPSSASKSSKKRRKKKRKQELSGKTPSAEQPDVAQRESSGTFPSRKTTILKCKLCNCEVEILTNSQSQRLIASKKDDFTCGLCDRPTQTGTGTEAPENPSICEICNRETDDLANHLNREHNVELVQYECIRCHIKFADGSRLKNHMNEFHSTNK